MGNTVMCCSNISASNKFVTMDRDKEGIKNLINKSIKICKRGKEAFKQ